MPTFDDEALRGMRELIDGLRADQAAAHAALDTAGIGERGAKLEIRIARLLRLHDAAPDLLDALERLAHMAECNTIPGPNTLKQARAAIAKARAD